MPAKDVSPPVRTTRTISFINLNRVKNIDYPPFFFYAYKRQIRVVVCFHYTPQDTRSPKQFFLKRIAGFPLRKAVRIGLFLKIFLLSSAVSLISLIGGYWLLEKEMVSRVSRILKSESQLVLDQLSHAIAIPVITDDRLTINDLLQTFSLQNGVKEIFVRGKDGKLLGDSIKGHPPVLGNQLPAVNAESKIFFHHFEQFKYALASKTIFFGKVPIGTISIVFSDKPYRIIRTPRWEDCVPCGFSSTSLSLP